MKIFCTLFFLVLLLNARAQNSMNFIYVDYSSTEELNKLVSKISEVFNSSEDQTLLFISKDSRPIIVENKNDLENSLNRIFSFRPSSPDCFEDIDSINSLLSNFNIISELENENPRIFLDNFNCYFFLDAEKFEFYNQDVILINQFLLSNRLLANNKLINNINLKIYLESKYNSEYIDNVRKNKPYEIFNY
jgi:hypothetical protein